MQRLFSYFILGLMVAFPYIIVAQVIEKPQQKAMQEALEYAQKNIFPLVQTQRKQLEKYLSSEDKAAIAQLRTQMQTLMKDIPQHQRGHWQGKRQAAKPQNLSPEQKKQLAEMIVSRIDMMQQARSIVQKYEPNIKTLLAPIRERKDIWKNDLQTIYQKYVPIPTNDTLNYSQTHKRGKGQKMILMAMLKQTLMPMGFLLLNPEEDLGQKLQDRLKAETKNTINEQDFSLYPNPVQDQSFVTYTLPTAGRVNINLLDAQGNLLKNLWAGEQEAGSYTQIFSLKEMAKGIYLYQIMLPKNTIIRRIVKE